jgi:hypothetical protein
VTLFRQIESLKARIANRTSRKQSTDADQRDLVRVMLKQLRREMRDAKKERAA